MKHCRHPTNRLSRSGIARLLLAGLLGLSPLSAKGSDWQGLYSVHAIEAAKYESEFTTLASLGMNTVVMNIGLDESNLDPNYPGWVQFYNSAIRHNLNLIAILWDPSKDQSVWNWTGTQFQIDAKQYPTDPGAHFLAWLHQDPARIAHTVAVYTFHEPFNPQNGNAQRSVLQNQTLWKQVHALYPDVKLYGESISHVHGCENGCADYVGIGVFSFASCNGKPLYSAVDVVPARQGVDFSTGLCQTSAAEVIQRARAMLDAMYTWSHGAPPAPDGTFTKFLPLIQTFVAPLPEVSRMPSAAEMRQWAEQIVLAGKDRELGMGWYPWGQVASSYTSWLSKDRFDTTGADRWSTVKRLARSLRKRR